MPGKPKGEITSVGPDPVKWETILSLTAVYAGSYAPWFYVTGSQNGTVVFEQYPRLLNGVGAAAVGPTPAADETQPGTGTVELGYFGSRGRYIAIDSRSFSIEPKA